MYVRKHWNQVATASDGTMKLYFDGQLAGGEITIDVGCSAFARMEKTGS
jgi:hypothetical protein